MQAVKLEGFESWQRRLASLGELRGSGAALRAEAEAIAAAARATLEARHGEGELARSVEIVDESQDTSARYAVGTRSAAGWYVEFGTRQRRASPWLGPALRASLPRINHTLRKMLTGALKALGRA